MNLGQQHAYMHGQAMNARASQMAQHQNAIGQVNNAIAGEMANRRNVMAQVRQHNADNTARIQQMQHERMMKAMDAQNAERDRQAKQQMVKDTLKGGLY